MDKPPQLVMIAGPNGAGKTTTAMRLLPEFLGIHEFVNADEIARGLNPLNPDGQAMAAGRLMLQRMSDLLAQRKSFAFETTGASRTFVSLLKAAKAAGYDIAILYVWLPSPDLAKRRVRFRVSLGGHNIPEADIERRYERSMQNLFQLYLPLVDEVQIMDNSQSKSDIDPDIIFEYQRDIDASYNNHGRFKPFESIGMNSSIKLDGPRFKAFSKGILKGRMDAIEKARQTGTKLAIWWEGAVREVTAEEMDEINRQGESKN